MTRTDWNNAKRTVEKYGHTSVVDHGERYDIEKYVPAECMAYMTEYSVYYFDGKRRNCIRTASSLSKLDYLFID